jgi:hypothetical protein
MLPANCGRWYRLESCSPSNCLPITFVTFEPEAFEQRFGEDEIYSVVGGMTHASSEELIGHLSIADE